MSSHHTTPRIKQAVLSITALLLFSVLGASPALAKACKNVHIEVKNNTSAAIVITDLDYWDSESEKWRSEPVKNTLISKSRTWQINRNLERVNGQSVKVKVKYKYKYKKWNKLFKRWDWKTHRTSYTSSSKTCTRNAEYLVQLR